MRDRVLGIEIAPRHFLGGIEFAFEGEHKGKILAHTRIGILLRRRFLERLLGFFESA
jgi:hypothetical protein